MMKKNPIFIWSDKWSDSWFIEDDKAWFVDGHSNILFRLDLESNECEYVCEIPGRSSNRFRLNPRCIKIENEIFCMPDIGDCIWVYNLKSSEFTKIEIENPNKLRVSLYDFWKYESKIFAISGLNKIIEIDIEKKAISNYYILCNSEEEKLGKCVRVGLEIYCVSSVLNQIYQFNLDSKTIMVHTIPNVESGFFAITYDGKKFWLSGYRKEIYIWDKENNSVEVINTFPEQFGIYDFIGDSENILDCQATVYKTPVFLELKSLGQYIWFIPFQTNKIIYVNKDTHDIYAFEIEGEVETKDSLSSAARILRHKYLLEYVRGNRYIGLFSLKKNCIVEIDTAEKKTDERIIILGNNSLPLLAEAYNNVVYYENKRTDKTFMEIKLLYANLKRQSEIMGNVGLKIYETNK